MMNAMAASAAQVRPQLLERRARLQSAAASGTGYLNDLLAQVDAALQRIDDGTYGICEQCHDTIEADRLQVNPLVRFCLDHLNQEERRAHEQDLELASQIQSRLLPPAAISLRHWETCYRYEAAGPVGGDYCDATVLGDGQSLFFAVGDVAGKGVAASLLMTHLSAIFRSLLPLHLPLAELMGRANRLFCESTLTSHYATLVCGRATGDGIELCNAGHCPPLVVRPGTVQKVDTAGLPLGLFCEVQYPVAHVSLEEGDGLVIYTDGITEALDPQGNEFGAEGLGNSLRQHFGGRAEALAGGVVQDVAGFRAGGRPTDDLTLLVVRRQS